jgi:hypothetical protein
VTSRATIRALAGAIIVSMMATTAGAGSGPVVTENAASCDIGPYPAATLLLPYFEVDCDAPATSAIDTVFSVINTSKNPQIVRMTVWTDLGFPAAWSSIFLTGFGTASVSMYNLIARGSYPTSSNMYPHGSMSSDNNANPNFYETTWCGWTGGAVAQELQMRLQNSLTTGERATSGCNVSTKHKHATGYVTLDVVNSCSVNSPLDPSYWTDVILYDNVLTGDYERINPNVTTGNYAGGNPLVHIRAVPDGGPAGSTASQILPFTFYDRYTPANARHLDRRVPLPSVFTARWISGGPTGFETNFVFWREGVVGPAAGECDYAQNATVPLKTSTLVRFDEHENAVALTCGNACLGVVPLASTISSNADLFPPVGGTSDVGGWLWIDLDNHAADASGSVYSTTRASQNWVIVQMYAEGRYGVDFDATSVANGCTVTPPAHP